MLLAPAAGGLWPPGPRPQGDSAVLLAQLAEGELRAPAFAHLEPRAESPYGVDLRIERLLRQAVGGDSVTQHAARQRMCIINRAGVTFPQQIPGGGQPRRTRSHDGNRLPGSGRARWRVWLRRGDIQIGGVTTQRADRQ